MINVSDALDDWTQTLRVKTIRVETVDFEEVKTVVGINYDAMVQPTKRTVLNADTLDWERKHITLIGYTLLKNGQIVEYKGRDYKIIETHDWEDNGYCRAVCEETNLPLVAETLP